MEAERKLRFCCLPPCEGLKSDLVHKFPKSDTRASQWISAIDLPELTSLGVAEVRKRKYLCTRHFRKEDYKHSQSRSLNITAIPSLNLKKLDKTIPIVVTKPRRTCCIPTCSNRSETLYDFPLNESIANQWKRVLNLRELEKLRLVEIHRRQIGICSRHFTQQDYDEKNGRLSQSAVPSMYLLLNTESTAQHLSTNKRSMEQAMSNITSQVKNPELKMIRVNTKKVKLIQHREEIVTMIDVVPVEEKEVEANIEEMFENMLKLTHKKLPSSVLKVNLYWLRDHCRCEGCFDSNTQQKRHYFASIPLTIKPATYELTDDGLNVTWEDDHKSFYTFEFLIEYNYETRQKIYQRSRAILWDKKTLEQSDYARVTLNDLLCDDENVTKILESLVKYGLAFIEKVPSTLHVTEMAITRMFPIMKTFFGELFEFGTNTNGSNHQDLAYSTECLPPHHDTTYLTESAGLQVITCTKFNGNGGENMAVDGFKAAENLRKKHPDSFGRFVHKWRVPSEYIEEGRNHRCTGPVITLDFTGQNIEQVRFNMNDLAIIDTVPIEDLQNFYTDMHRFAEEILNSENEFLFRLNPGTVWIFDNYRVMHGRNGFTGQRVMAGAYVQRTEFLSACRVAGVL